jgi:hypothetical protein
MFLSAPKPKAQSPKPLQFVVAASLCVFVAACGKSEEQTPAGAAGMSVAGGSAGTGGAPSGGAGSSGASGATGGGGTAAACDQIVGVNDAALSVRRSNISTRIVGTQAGTEIMRIARDPSTGNVYYMGRLCQFWQLDLTTGASTAVDMGFGGTDCRGMVFGSDGTLYLQSHEGELNPMVSVVISKGVPAGNGSRTWTTIATSDSYAIGGSDFDHRFAGLEISADEQYVYFGSGSRTDHGELEGATREEPLTSAIFRVPTSGADILLANDETELQPYLFADGFRNPFDLTRNAEGELFATENGPDLDFPEELNWIQEGQRYGFPWRFGNEDNPTLDPAYDDANDTRLHPGYSAFDRGTYAYDADFPAAPPDGLTDAILNHGPDADKFRSGPTSDVLDASDMGQTLAGITAHRSPLGLSFHTGTTALCGDYDKAGFLLSFGPVLDVMGDPGGDLLLVNLTKNGANYEMNTTQIVAGFEAPVDSVMVDNKLYVVSYLTGANIYEITFPFAP